LLSQENAHIGSVFAAHRGQHFPHELSVLVRASDIFHRRLLHSQPWIWPASKAAFAVPPAECQYRSGFVVSLTQHGLNVFLQGGEESVLPAQRIIDGGDYRLLDGVFQPADAPPDDGFLPMVVPMDSAENLVAVSANNHL
jgi:hypothetical protein